MSDFPGAVYTQEEIDAAVARDARIKRVIAMHEMRGSLADGAPLWLVMAKLREDADVAMTEFATANLGDVLSLQDLQARVFRFRVAFETFAMVIDQGLVAEASIRGELPAHDDQGDG